MIEKLSDIKNNETLAKDNEAIFLLQYRSKAALTKVINLGKLLPVKTENSERYYKLCDLYGLLKYRIEQNYIDRQETINKLNSFVFSNALIPKEVPKGEIEKVLGIDRNETKSEAERYLKVEQAIKQKIENNFRLGQLIEKEAIEKEFGDICRSLWKNLINMVEKFSIEFSLTPIQKKKAFEALTAVLEKFKKEGEKL